MAGLVRPPIPHSHAGGKNLRLALISLAERTEDSTAALRGGLRLAGRSLALRQLDFARSLGCERLVCLTRGIGPAALELQHAAEQAGLRCSTVSNGGQMLGMVSAADTVLLLADGLLLSDPQAGAILAEGPAVLTLPAARACPDGFERIDAVHAWAGAALLPGRCVERLADLPDDIDPLSALLRIGLQLHTPLRALPEEGFIRGHWLLVRSEAALRRIEPEWLAALLPAAAPTAPAQILARTTLRQFAPRMVARPRIARKLVIGAGLTLLTAGLQALLAQPVAGLILAAIAWLVFELARMTDRLCQEGRAPRTTGKHDQSLAAAAFDLAGAGILLAAQAALAAVPLFLAVLPFLSLRMSRHLPLGRWAGLAQDRMALCLLLAAGLAAGRLDLALLGHSLILLALAALLPPEKTS